MSILKENKAFFLLSILFIVINSFLIYKELYLGILIPFALLISWFAFINLELFLLTVVFFTPLSVLASKIFPGIPVDLSLPTEPLFVILLFIFLLKKLNGQKAERKFLLHPVTIAITVNLLWIFYTSLTSTMPFISFKFFISRLWFVLPLYFFVVYFFKKPGFIKKYIWAFIIPFIFVIFYDLFNHLSVGLFAKHAAHGAMKPFFNDHTSYGAILAMYIPILFGFLFFKNYKKPKKYIIFSILGLFLFALIFSYTRAAWISVLTSAGVFLVIKLKINKTLLITGSVTIVALFFIFQFEITDSLKKNRQDSSEDLSEHVQSVSNIATDASNLERLNRWNSAIKMFKEKPILGFGPGTYMFQYAPYQMSFDRTIISTNFGEGGNAHSEYIGPLAESGLLGTLSFLAIILTTIITGIRVYYRSQSSELKILALSALLGLITYYIHGFLNNFLDTDKASVPFWGFTAIIVAIDIFRHKKNSGMKKGSIIDSKINRVD